MLKGWVPQNSWLGAFGHPVILLIRAQLGVLVDKYFRVAMAGGGEGCFHIIMATTQLNISPINSYEKHAWRPLREFACCFRSLKGSFSLHHTAGGFR